MCRSNTPLEAHDPPLLYDLHKDPGELYELDPDEYADVLEKIDKVRKERGKKKRGRWERIMEREKDGEGKEGKRGGREEGGETEKGEIGKRFESGP